MATLYTLVNAVLRPNLYGCRMAQTIKLWVQGRGVRDGELAGWLDDLAEQDRQIAFFYSADRCSCCCVRGPCRWAGSE